MNNDFFELANKILSKQYTTDEKKLHNYLLHNNDYKKFFYWYMSKWENKKDFSSKIFNYSRGLKLLRTKIAQSENGTVGIRTNEFWLTKKFVQLAASIVIIISFGIISFNYIKGDLEQSQDKIITYVSGKGERTKLELPDGSWVYLNSKSKISYPEKFSKKERKVELSGEAFFEVVHDEKHPFVVQTGEISTTVLGTTFNVSTQQDFVTVTLETGKVKINGIKNSKGIYLNPGEQFRFNIQNGKYRKAEVNTSLFTDWRNGILQFNEISFGDAIHQLENWYNIQIQCDSKELLHRNIRGKYMNEDFKTVMEDLEFMFEFNYEFLNDSAVKIKSN